MIMYLWFNGIENKPGKGRFIFNMCFTVLFMNKKLGPLIKVDAAIIFLKVPS